MVQGAWEASALALRREFCLSGPPVNAFEIAEVCGLKLVPSLERRSSLSPQGELRYPTSEYRVRQQGIVAHQMGHWTLRWLGEKDSDRGAHWVAGALMLPKLHFDRDLWTTSWDLRELRAKHLNVSAEMIARRIVQLRDAVVTIFDHGRVKVRVASPWLGGQFKRLSRFERNLAEICFETEEVLRAGELLWAFPIVEGGHRYVVLVCEAAQLSLRL
jgi:hypothetical protein